MSFYDPQEHGGVTDEELQKFFDDNPGLRPLSPVGEGDSGSGEGDDSGAPPAPDSEPETSPTPPTTPAPDPDGVPAPSEAEPDVPSSASSGSDFLEIDGTPIPRSQLEAAARFNRHLSNDAGLQQVIRNYLTGEGAVAPEGRSVPSGAPPAPVAPVMPEGLDLEDPSIRALYSVIQQQNERFDQLSRGLQVTSTQQAHSQQQQYQAQYNEAAESFAKDHDLSPDEVQQLGNIGARMNNIGAFMQEFDPITGVPRKPNMIQAYKQALEQVYYMVPEYRDREFRKSVETMQERSKKQKLLGAVGGSSGSVSRTQTPAPPGSRESKNDMIREVASMMSGEWSEPSAAN